MTSLYEETKLYILRNGRLLGIRSFIQQYQRNLNIHSDNYFYILDIRIWIGYDNDEKDLVYYFGLLGMLSGLLGVGS